MQQKIPTEEIERAIDNFQSRVAAVFAHGARISRLDAAKQVLGEALALHAPRASASTT